MKWVLHIHIITIFRKYFKIMYRKIENIYREKIYIFNHYIIWLNASSIFKEKKRKINIVHTKLYYCYYTFRKNNLTSFVSIYIIIGEIIAMFDFLACASTSYPIPRQGSPYSADRNFYSRTVWLTSSYMVDATRRILRDQSVWKSRPLTTFWTIFQSISSFLSLESNVLYFIFFPNNYYLNSLEWNLILKSKNYVSRE